jgi:UDP-N-acetylmuramate dehydrogenase
MALDASKYASLTAGLKAESLMDEPLSRHTSLRIGGPAGFFIEVADPFTLAALVSRARQAGAAVMFIGGGTNLLFSDAGFEGVVICLKGLRGYEVLRGEADDGCVRIRAAAGTALQVLVQTAAREGLAGMEGLAGIPGTLGGAIAGNAGSFGCEMKDVVESVTVMGLDGGSMRMENEDIKFGYRTSALAGGSLTVIEAVMRLSAGGPEEVSARVRENLEKKKLSQPLDEWSAGCVFKNPPGELSAGRLIDMCGLKGAREGGVEVSARHANFFVNTGGAAADDFLRLMDRAAGAVRAAFGVVLEPEIRVIVRRARAAAKTDLG